MPKNNRSSKQKGFTLLNALFAFSLFLLLVSFFPIAIKIIKTETPPATFFVDLFFEYIQKEIVQAKQLSTSGNSLSLTMPDGTKIHYQKYNTNIRRVVDGVGNEFLLQNVEDVRYEPVENGVMVSVKVAGRVINKRISMAPKL